MLEPAFFLRVILAILWGQVCHCSTGQHSARQLTCRLAGYVIVHVIYLAFACGSITFLWGSMINTCDTHVFFFSSKQAQLYSLPAPASLLMAD